MRDLLFQLGVSTLLVHELDATTQSEWKLLFILRGFPDLLARNLFVALHVPIVAVMLWLTQHPSVSVQRWTRIGLALFMVVHAGLHWNMRNHALNTFTSPLSLSLIYGAGLIGSIYIILVILGELPNFLREGRICSTEDG